MIYLDNAATSYPKPEVVINAFAQSVEKYGANPGRGGYDFSVKTAEKVFETRMVLNEFFNGYGEENIAFASSCTHALNTAIKGLAMRGTHVLISSLEHNSVLRPVYALKKANVVDFSVFKVEKNKEKTLENFRKAMRKNTKMCVATAVSNVFGYTLPLKEMSRIIHNNNGVFIVDGAQGAGVIELDMKEQGIDCLCLPGHKGLLGTMGTGVLLHNGSKIRPLIHGGTGTASLEYNQPEQFPESLESGTLNVPGICALCEGVKYVKNRGVSDIFQKETLLAQELFDGLKSIENVICYEEYYDECPRAPVVSFNVRNMHSEKVAFMLNEKNVCVRGGFHCSALAHSYSGTKGVGTVRVSPSCNNTKKDINYLLNLVEKIALL